LPGRGDHGIELAKIYKKLKLNALIIGVTPVSRCWYPMPNGVGDQDAAIAGLEIAVSTVEKIVKKIENRYQISRKMIALIGYSAGAVVGLLTAMYSNSCFGCVVAHAGAILDTDMVPKCYFKECPILLTHSRDDVIFEWHERYLPMLAALQNKNYRVYTATENDYGHGVSLRQFVISKRFIETVLKLS
jgi:predicted esterase